MSQSIITFYDIRTNIKPFPAFSANTLRVRYALNYKGLAYKTVWLEYTEIEPLCKSLGAAPTSKKPNGDPLYTLPVIHDPSTGTIISDGPEIVEYLDKAYPSTPVLLPHENIALQLAFCDAIASRFLGLYAYFAVHIPNKLNPESQEYWRKTRSELFGKNKFEDIAPVGEELVVAWKKLKDGFGEIDGWLKKTEGPFVTGDKPLFVDFTLAAMFIGMRIAFGEESEEWKDIVTWHGGRWLLLRLDSGIGVGEILQHKVHWMFGAGRRSSVHKTKFPDGHATRMNEIKMAVK